MAAYRRVYDSRHLQADCQEPGSAREPYARQSRMGYLFLQVITVLFTTCVSFCANYLLYVRTMFIL